MVEPDAVLEVANGVLDLGVAAMVGLEVQRVALAVGDEGVVALRSKQRQLGAGRGLDPPYDEPHRRGVGLALEGDIRGLGHVGGAVHPVGDGRPLFLGYGLYEVAQSGVLADGDGEADTLIAAAHCLNKTVTQRKWLPQIKCYPNSGRRSRGRRH